MIKVGITGRSGQLGQCIMEIAAEYSELEIVAFNKAEWDITDSRRSRELFDLESFDLLINTAAFTAVDQAEESEDHCMEINALAVSELASLCKNHACHLIQISTDYVYHNHLRRPLKENDLCCPQGIYALSKMRAEEAIHAEAISSTIFRTSWVYSVFGHNFVKTMMRLSKKLKTITVVQDQWGCPTSAHDLASALLEYVISMKWQKEEVTTYNYTNEGLTNWYEMARFIFREMNVDMNVMPVTTESFGASAPRPEWSILNCQDFDALAISERPHWKISMKKSLDRLKTFS